MRAQILRGAGDLVRGDSPVPAPAPDQVLLRVSHSGICGTDLKIFSGSMPAPYPIIMGHEIAGELISGSHGAPLQPGQRVVVDPVLYCGECNHCRAGRTNLCPHRGIIGREVNGGFADYLVAPASHVYPLPESIDDRTAPLIQVLTTCLHAQRRAGVGAGQSVAVAGLGVSGQLHVQLAKARGAYPVIGISRSAWKRQLAEELGADITVTPGKESIEVTSMATNGQGADVVIECTGVLGSMADSIAIVRPGGTVLLFGIYTATEGALPFYQLYFKEPTLMSARAATSRDFPESIDLVAQGAVRLSPLVTQVLPLSELGQALEMLSNDVDGRMKIILEN